MRSFTLESGLKNSSLSRISAWAPCSRAVRLRRTSGVLPMVSTMLLKMRAMVVVVGWAVSGKWREGAELEVGRMDWFGLRVCR